MGLMTTTNVRADLDTLARLNDDYITAVKTSNVERFREILAGDFLCTQADGSLLDREQFLGRLSQPYTIRDLQVHDVTIRLLGDVAIVHARTTFMLPDGSPGTGRYTDVWARRGGRWSRWRPRHAPLTGETTHARGEIMTSSSRQNPVTYVRS
jgi:ketosteroid isomerase-like protein